MKQQLLPVYYFALSYLYMNTSLPALVVPNRFHTSEWLNQKWKNTFSICNGSFCPQNFQSNMQHVILILSDWAFHSRVIAIVLTVTVIILDHESKFSIL